MTDCFDYDYPSDAFGLIFGEVKSITFSCLFVAKYRLPSTYCLLITFDLYYYSTFLKPSSSFTYFDI